MAIVLVPALVGAVLVVALDEDPTTTASPAAPMPDVASIDLGASGVVVTLAKAGADLPVMAGSPAAFHVGFAATTPVSRVELWDGAVPVATYEPAAGRTDGRPRLEWAPTGTGTRLITARAYDTDGRVGLSNPIWVQVDDPIPDLPIDDDPNFSLDPSLDPGADEEPDATDSPVDDATDSPVVHSDNLADRLAVDTRVALIPRSFPTGSVGRQPSPRPLLSAGAFSVDGCEVTVSPDLAAGAEGHTFTLLMAPPGGTALVPVAAIDADNPSLTASLPSGPSGFVLVTASDGLIVDWSAPTVVEVDDGCTSPNWSSAEGLDLRDGRLFNATADRAYLYVEGRPGVWSRAPAQGSVRRSGNTFNFGAHLQAIGEPTQYQAWGWRGGALVYLGSGHKAPVADATLTPDLPAMSATPSISLLYVQPATDDEPESLQYEGVIDVDPLTDLIGTHRFRLFQTNVPMTHVLVQVTHLPFMDKYGPLDAPSAFTCLVPAAASEFEIDFDALTCSPAYVPTPADLVPISGLLVTDLAINGSGSGPGTNPNWSEIDALAAAMSQVYDDPEMSPEEAFDDSVSTAPEDHLDILPWDQRRYIRALPMSSSVWSGQKSSQVTLVLDRTPLPPSGEPAYEIDVKLLRGPYAPHYSYAACWTFTGWNDPAAAQAAAAAGKAAVINAYNNPPPTFVGPGNKVAAAYAAMAAHPHYYWSEVMADIGPGPICPGWCYKVHFDGLFSATVGFAGADCSTSSTFWEDPIGWTITNIGGAIYALVKELVNMAADGFAYLKKQAVEGVMQATGCTGSFCKLIAESVVNGLLIAVGIPPTIPNFDQLVQIGKGELIEAAVELAKAAGVPCDEVGAVASVADQPDLTCNALIERFIDEAVKEFNQGFIDVANSAGFGFHSDMVMKPWWAGQVGLAEVEITVRPTQYSYELEGQTCSVGVLSAARWTAPSLTHGIEGLGTVTLPTTEWDAMAYEIQWFRLPDLELSGTGSSATYQPATQRYTMYPTAETDVVTVIRPSVTIGTGSLSITTPASEVQVSPYTFLFHEGATFQFAIGGSCADGETHTYTLDGSVTEQLVSIEGW